MFWFYSRIVTGSYGSACTVLLSRENCYSTTSCRCWTVKWVTNLFGSVILSVTPGRFLPDVLQEKSTEIYGSNLIMNWNATHPVLDLSCFHHGAHCTFCYHSNKIYIMSGYMCFIVTEIVTVEPSTFSTTFLFCSQYYVVAAKTPSAKRAQLPVVSIAG